MRDLYLVLTSVVISVIVTLFLTEQQPKIVVVDRDEIFKSMVVKIEQATATDDEKTLELKLEKYRNTKDLLDHKMAEIAKEKNFIILPKDRVIGGEDLTDQAKSLLSDLIEERKRSND
jgi:hypothetical protein